MSPLGLSVLSPVSVSKRVLEERCDGEGGLETRGWGGVSLELFNGCSRSGPNVSHKQ